ncbi:MAG TPA: TIGR02266 family protein [Polyangiaceae bacterium]|jgi:uncharacterized protein (TIGR02266 family)|nr:TIGR02266 family protein [Polyangiaceae bacterium]
MIQETRKDPRAKVLSMTVRYKSATLDEFIEHHSHDISRGGMFIKTPAPFPGGTLLKFEVRIAEEQKVVQGVGRVVWKRDAASASPDSPAGMGVKFIKLDDESKQLIDRLISKRGQAEGAYDAGERISGDNVPTTPQPVAGAQASIPTEARAVPIRKGTMIGLGAMKPGSAPAPATAWQQPGGSPSRPPATASTPPSPAKTPAPPASDGGFFPKSEPLVQPPPEDQTVMRQAAELLRDALREAGGSLDEIGTTGAAPVVAAPEPDSSRVIAPKPMLAGNAAKTDSAPPAKMDSAPPVPVSSKTDSGPVSAKPVAARSPSVPPASTGSRRPLPRSPSVPPDSRHPPAQTGLKSGLWMLIGVAALGSGIFFFAQRNKPEPAAPEPSATPAATAAPAPEPTPALSATAEPLAEPSASVAPPETAAEKAAREKAEAEAAKKAEADAKKAEADAKKAEADAKKAADAEAKKAALAAKKAELDAKRAAAEESLRAARVAAAARAATAMKPAAPKPAAPLPTAPAAGTEEPAPAPTEKAVPAPPPPAATTTAEKPSPPATAAPTGAPTTSAKPKPAPAPKGGESDNPY